MHSSNTYLVPDVSSAVSGAPSRDSARTIAVIAGASDSQLVVGFRIRSNGRYRALRSGEVRISNSFPALLHQESCGTRNPLCSTDGGRLALGIPKESLWAYDPGGLNQIGCVYTAQGFEFDYVGVIFGH